jgi:putative transposase
MLLLYATANMSFNPELHRRRSIRLPGYDYTSTGAYFITICTSGKECLFGMVENGQMRINDAGRIVAQCWLDIPLHFPHAILDECVVMPNHVHGIVMIDDGKVGAKNFSPLRGTSKTIGSIVRGFKIGVTKWMRQNTSIHQVWQRNFYEHIIRNETELNGIREYIQNNPARWELDDLHVFLQAESASTCPPASPS